MSKHRVKLDFCVAADERVAEVAEAVLAHFYTAPQWTPPPAPPTSAAELRAALEAFTHARAVAHQGGPAQTAGKNQARAHLLDRLRQLAGFVQENHGNDLAKLLASGFQAASLNRAPAPLPRVTIRRLRLGQSGELFVSVVSLANAKTYEPQHALVGPDGTPGPWVGAAISSNSRKLRLAGLTPGAQYAIRVRAHGGSTGASDWSDTHRTRVL